MSSSNIKLIVGLGNPGQEYQYTRHNAGAWFVEALATHHKTPLVPEKKFKGLYAKAYLFQQDIHLLIPTTFMNLSGESVSAIAHFYKILPEEILIIHDELALPTGTLRLKQGGGHAGHNGLKSIMAHLNSSDFFRLRIGIGHPGHKDHVTQHVLSKAKKDEQQKIDDAIIEGMNILPDLLSGNFQKAMHTLHTEK